MKSASNGDVLNGSLYVLNIHVLLMATLGAKHIPEPDTDWHEYRVVVSMLLLAIDC